jgi:hypothetical protein
MKKISFISFFLLLFLLFSRNLFYYKQFTQIFLKDMEKIFKILKNNHPGYFNEDDAQFKKILERIESTYKKISAENKEEYILEIKNLLKEFNDTHLGIFEDKKITNKEKEIDANFKLNDRENFLYLKIPHFNPSKNEITTLNKIINFLTNNTINKPVIFDLQDNFGGNSFYGGEILKALFGNNYYKETIATYFQDNPNIINWRASEENLNHLKAYKKLYKDNSDFSQWLKTIIDGMEESLLKNSIYFREIEQCKTLNFSKKISKFNFPIIILTNKKCISACLDFIDEIYILSEKNKNSVIQLGEETGYDTQYMDIREVDLSENIKFFFPIKVYKNRKRKPYRRYKPDIIINNTLLNISEKQNESII